MLQKRVGYEWESILKVAWKAAGPVSVFILCMKMEVFGNSIYRHLICSKIWKVLSYGSIYPYNTLFWGHVSVDSGSFSN